MLTTPTKKHLVNDVSVLVAVYLHIFFQVSVSSTQRGKIVSTGNKPVGKLLTPPRNND